MIAFDHLGGSTQGYTPGNQGDARSWFTANRSGACPSTTEPSPEPAPEPARDVGIDAPMDAFDGPTATKKSKISALHAELVVETIFDCMRSAFQQGERVEVRGLGTFQVRSYKGYQGRNPKTGQALTVQPKQLPVFKVGRGLAVRVAEQPHAKPNMSLPRG